jgi:hypothetical protein
LCVKESFAVAFVGPNCREHQAEIGGTHQHGNAKDSIDDPTVIKPTLRFFVQKPQVLQADIAKVVASNQGIFVSRKAMAETEVMIR